MSLFVSTWHCCMHCGYVWLMSYAVTLFRKQKENEFHVFGLWQWMNEARDVYVDANEWCTYLETWWRSRRRLRAHSRPKEKRQWKMLWGENHKLTDIPTRRSRERAREEKRFKYFSHAQATGDSIFTVCCRFLFGQTNCSVDKQSHISFNVWVYFIFLSFSFSPYTTFIHMDMHMIHCCVHVFLFTFFGLCYYFIFVIFVARCESIHKNSYQTIQIQTSAFIRNRSSVEYSSILQLPYGNAFIRIHSHGKDETLAINGNRMTKKINRRRNNCTMNYYFNMGNFNSIIFQNFCGWCQNGSWQSCIVERPSTTSAPFICFDGGGWTYTYVRDSHCEHRTRCTSTDQCDTQWKWNT